MSEIVDFGMNLMEEEIDQVIFATNQFLCNETFIGQGGPFFFILQLALSLSAMFSIITVGSMALRTILKKEPIDVFKLMKPLAVSLVLMYWYPTSMTGMGANSCNYGVPGLLSIVPNCIGSYTHELYSAEATQVQETFDSLQSVMKVRDDVQDSLRAKTEVNNAQASDLSKTATDEGYVDFSSLLQSLLTAKKQQLTSAQAGTLVMVDKFIMFIALITYRVGWWGTIYCQQILLGMLTIFGPIQWAFSILPKWEGAWAKWTIRYLTVHFYGAMLYFVGFYVLLLFDIVLSIQYADLQSAMSSIDSYQAFAENCVLTAGYMMAASCVSLKCLSLTPDLAAWMIPEGDTAFSTRAFGQGVAESTKSAVMGLGGTVSSMIGGKR